MSVFLRPLRAPRPRRRAQGPHHALLPRLRPWPRAQVPRRGDRRARHPGPHGAVCPVGCSVFLYYYFDVGNTQAAHGRAPAVALGHKLANPDRSSSATRATATSPRSASPRPCSTAQLGLPITVVFINNAIYGMTGGQMAPTTADGPEDRHQPLRPQPLHGPAAEVAELIAGLDGPVYVERVALFDAKQRTAAARRSRRRSGCRWRARASPSSRCSPSARPHLKLTPEETEKWVKEKMVPVFPLGVKKDADRAKPWFEPPAALRPGDGARPSSAASGEAPHASARASRRTSRRDIGLKLAGAGGDGAQTAAMLIACAAINEGFDATHIPSYGPESRGGTSYADVHIAAGEVLSPAVAGARRAGRLQRARASRSSGRR